MKNIDNPKNDILDGNIYPCEKKITRNLLKSETENRLK